MLNWNRNRIGRAAGAAVLGGLLALPAASAPGDTVGSVLSASGAAHIEGPEGRRPLGCGESVREGERIVTTSGATVSVTAGDTYLQVARDTVVRMDGSGRFQLERGLARFIDVADGANEIAVGTPHGQLTARGGDTEVSVNAGQAEFCERGRAVEVSAGSTRETLARAQCATAQGGSIRLAPAGDSRVALSGAQGCIDIAVMNHLSPTDVAAPPPSVGLYPFDPDKRTYQPCDAAGSCGAIVVPMGTRSPDPTPDPPSFGFGTGPADDPSPGQTP